MEGNIRSDDQILLPKNKQFLVISSNHIATFVVSSNYSLPRISSLERREVK